jgi:hypothetical protein
MTVGVGRPSDGEIAAGMAKLAEICVRTANDVGGVKLDYSSSSISMLDAHVGRFWPEGKTGAEKEIPGAITAAAAYLGEVIVRNTSGVRWTWATNWKTSVLEFPRGEQADMTTWIYKRITEGQAQRDLRNYYDVALKLAAQRVTLEEIGTPWPWWKRLLARFQR